MSGVKRPRGTGSIFQRAGVWWVKFHHNGRAYRESSHSTREKDAQRLLARRLGQIACGQFTGLQPEKVTISQICQLVVDDHKHRRLRSTSMVEGRIKDHIAPFFGDVRAANFGLATVKSYVQKRRTQSAADATINRELAVIRRAFTLALQQDPPLVTRAPFIPKLAENNARKGFVEHEMYMKLLAALPQHLKCILVVGFHAGCRLGELRQLRWDQVDFSAGEIKLYETQTKAKTARTLPIYGDMREWLEIQKEDRDMNWPSCRYVFHYLGRRIGSHLKGWSRSCKNAGLEGLRFHDLRRSAVRNMERAGIPHKIAMSISGHKTESVYKRYDIVSAADMRLAAQRMETYLGQFKKGRASSLAELVTPTGKIN